MDMKQRKKVVALALSGLFILALMEVFWLSPDRYSTRVQPQNTEETENVASDM